MPPLPDAPPHSPRAALRAAQSLLDEGRHFQAHEVLEAAWKAAPAPERGLWRGLTQIVVGLVHTARGNQRGAVALLRRGLDGIAPYLPPPGAPQPRPGDVDLPEVARWAGELLARLEATQVPGPEPSPPRLVAPERGGSSRTERVLMVAPVRVSAEAARSLCLLPRRSG